MMKYSLICLSKRLAALSMSCVMISLSSVTAVAESDDFIEEVSCPPSIVFMGDSIATGFGLEGYTSSNKSICASYANILSEAFDEALPEEADFSSVNLAQDGLTSTELLESLESGEYDEYIADADAVVLSIGGNDLLGPFLSTFTSSDLDLSDLIDGFMNLDTQLDENLDAFEATLSDIVESISSLSQKDDFTLFIQTLYNPFDDYSISMIADLGEEKIGRLNEIIIDCSQDESLFRVADVATAFDGRAEELTNISDLDIHPNAQGHAEIASVLEPIIESETYTYYDEEAALAAQEAAMQKQLEEENERQQQEQRREKITIAAAIAAAAVAIGAVSVTIFTKRRSRKKK